MAKTCANSPNKKFQNITAAPAQTEVSKSLSNGMRGNIKNKKIITFFKRKKSKESPFTNEKASKKSQKIYDI